ACYVSRLSLSMLRRCFLVTAYLLAPQWQSRSPEQQFPGSASLPSGPMQVWVMAHQKRPSPERGTVGSGSDQMYWLFQCKAEHSPARSVLNLSGTLLMRHLLFPHHAQHRRALGTPLLAVIR